MSLKRCGALVLAIRRLGRGRADWDTTAGASAVAPAALLFEADNCLQRASLVGLLPGHIKPECTAL